jgi:hypothetical protein
MSDPKVFDVLEFSKLFQCFPRLLVSFHDKYEWMKTWLIRRCSHAIQMEWWFIEIELFSDSFQVSAWWEVSCNIRRVSFSVNHTNLAEVVFKEDIHYIGAWWWVWTMMTILRRRLLKVSISSLIRCFSKYYHTSRTTTSLTSDSSTADSTAFPTTHRCGEL